jgi:hypothetical protein
MAARPLRTVSSFFFVRVESVELGIILGKDPDETALTPGALDVSLHESPRSGPLFGGWDLVGWPVRRQPAIEQGGQQFHVIVFFPRPTDRAHHSYPVGLPGSPVPTFRKPSDDQPRSDQHPENNNYDNGFPGHDTPLAPPARANDPISGGPVGSAWLTEFRHAGRNGRVQDAGLFAEPVGQEWNPSSAGGTGADRSRTDDLLVANQSLSH